MAVTYLHHSQCVQRDTVEGLPPLPVGRSGAHRSQRVLVRLQEGPTRSSPSVYGRSVRLADMATQEKVFTEPSTPFKIDTVAAKQFVADTYGPRVPLDAPAADGVAYARLSVWNTGRRWGAGLGAGIGTFLMSATWCGAPAVSLSLSLSTDRERERERECVRVLALLGHRERERERGVPRGVGRLSLQRGAGCRTSCCCSR